MKPNPISIEELTRAFDEIKYNDKDGMTSREFADAWGVSVRVARERIKKMLAAGMAKFNGRKQRTKMDGKVDYIPVYVLTKDNCGE